MSQKRYLLIHRRVAQGNEPSTVERGTLKQALGQDGNSNFVTSCSAEGK